MKMTLKHGKILSQHCLIRNNSLSLSYYTNPLKNEFTFTQIKETNSEMVYFIS